MKKTLLFVGAFLFLASLTTYAVDLESATVAELDELISQKASDLKLVNFYETIKAIKQKNITYHHSPLRICLLKKG